jgi:hypothetical protein
MHRALRRRPISSVSTTVSSLLQLVAHAALIRLRDSFIERIIWADTVCIDQENLRERVIQVQSMVVIYAKATRALIWLGDNDADGTEALDGIHRAADEIYSSHIEDESDTTCHKSILEMIKRL